MSVGIKRRRGTTAEHELFTGLEAELTVDLTKKTVVVHDGATAGGNPLATEANLAAGVSEAKTYTDDSLVPVASQLAAKATKAAAPTAGHIATLDSNGNPVDSGRALSEYAAVSTYALIERVIVGYSKTTDTTFATGKTYYRNTGTAINPVYVALVENTDWTAGGTQTTGSVAISELFVYSTAGVASLVRTQKPDGIAYALKRALCKYEFEAGSAGASRLQAVVGTSPSATTLMLYTPSGFAAAKRSGYGEVFAVDGYWRTARAGAMAAVNSDVTGYAPYLDAVNARAVATYPTITSLTLDNSGGVIPSGSIIEIWGCEV